MNSTIFDLDNARKQFSLLKRFNAVKINKLGYPYQVETTAGSYIFSFDLKDGLPSIFGRFEDPKLATSKDVFCNPHSGKYNFHMADAQKCLRDFENFLLGIVK